MYLLLAASLVLSFADSVQIHYSEKNTEGLRRLCEQSTTQEGELLCRYRLYPLTQDERYIADVPAELDAASARALALLSGLWGYRAAQAPWHLALKYGLVSDRLLKQAKGLDAREPYVLLVEGQSLLFRPALAGGSASEALARFRTLRRLIREDAGSGISTMESDLWIWYALRKTRSAEAQAFRASLLEREPPRLYREFLDGA